MNFWGTVSVDDGYILSFYEVGNCFSVFETECVLRQTEAVVSQQGTLISLLSHPRLWTH